MLNSQASSTVFVSASFGTDSVGLGIAVNGCVQSPLPTGNGVSGNGLVLTGVRGGLLDVGSRVRLILASLGRRLYAPGASVLVSSSDKRPRRREIGCAKGVTGDMRSGFSALPWKGPAVVLERGMVTEWLLPVRECATLPLRDWVRWLFCPEVRGRLLRDS